MSLKSVRFAAGLWALVLGLGPVNCARAQAAQAAATLSGTVTAGTGAVVPNAKVSVKNAAGEMAMETQTDAGATRCQTSRPGITT